MRNDQEHDRDFVLPAGLTASQLEAIEAPEPILCVLAGAGAGKTRVLTLRVARRIHEEEVDPAHALVCTFSRKAAEELGRRLWALDVGEVVAAGTFHRIALSLLRQYRAEHRLAPPTVLGDRRGFLTTVGLTSVSDQRPPSDQRTRRGRPAAADRTLSDWATAEVDNEIGWAKALMLSPSEYAPAASSQHRRTQMTHERIAALYQHYEHARRQKGLLDLDDLLTACSDLLASDMAFADAIRWRFRHLFVDEMQDVNPSQFRLLTSLLGDEPDLTVVGDPHQSIYGFNGADPTLISRLPELLPGSKVVRLEENHRCSPQVVATASAALGLGSGRAHQPERGTPPTSTRADGPVPRVRAHQSDRAEAEWVAHEIWLAHRPGRAWSQIAVLARTNAQLDTMSEALDGASIPFRRAGADLGPASDLGADLGEADRHDPESGSSPGRSAARSHGPDGVALSTFHRSKGLQWPTVFVVGLSDGLVPHASANQPHEIEEERRLLYVALTRSEDELTCTWSRFREAPGSPRTERSASPWLAPVVRTLERLRTQSLPLSPREASGRVAELRRRLQSGYPESASVDPPSCASPDPPTSTTTGA